MMADQNLTQRDNALKGVAFDQDAVAKCRELDLKEREIALKERELAGKELEAQKSRWLNPAGIGLFVAGLGLFGSLVVARINNSNSQEVERIRSQSTLVVEAIKTGDPVKACQNLTLFVRLGLIDDNKFAIRNDCSTAPMTGPSLPVNGLDRPPNRPPNKDWVSGIVQDANSGAPLGGASIYCLEALSRPAQKSDAKGYFEYQVPYTLYFDDSLRLRIEKDGYRKTEVSIRIGDSRIISLERETSGAR